MSRLYEPWMAPKKVPEQKCQGCGFTFPRSQRVYCVQCLAIAAIREGQDPAPLLEIATQKERDNLHILRPISSDDKSSDWRDLGDVFYRPTYIDSVVPPSIVARYQRPSRRTRPTATERGEVERYKRRMAAMVAWRQREAELPATVTQKQREVMKGKALGETVPNMAARLGISEDSVKDRIRRGEHLEERKKRKSRISGR